MKCISKKYYLLEHIMLKYYGFLINRERN